MQPYNALHDDLVVDSRSDFELLFVWVGFWLAILVIANFF